jgi:hypothetical protein
MDQRCIIFLNIFFMLKKIWLQNYFDMCFDNIIKCITSLLYTTYFMMSTHLYLYKKKFNETNIQVSKEKRKPKHLEPIYLWNYLTKKKEKIKSFDTTIIQKKLMK